MKISAMKILRPGLFLAAVLAIGAPAQKADALTLELNSSGGTVLTVDDNSALDDDATDGVIVFNGSIDDFTVAVVTTLSKPMIGNASEARINLTAITTTGNVGGTLILSLTDTGFSSGGSGQTNVNSVTGGVTEGTMTLQGYADSTNAAFGAECTTGLQGPFGPGAFDDVASGSCFVSGDFSLTAVAEIALGADSTQSFNADLRAILLEETVLACRFTGGGVDTDLNWNHELEDGETVRNGSGNLPPGIDRYQFGGQVGASTALPPQPSGEWQHHQQKGPSGAFSFHVGTASARPETRITDVRCSDPGFCNPARPAPTKQLDFDGIGTFSNMGKGPKTPVFEIPNPNVIPEPNGKKNSPFTLHWVQVNIDDLGEPGRLNSGAPNSTACPGRGFGEKSSGPYVPDPVNNPGTMIFLPATDLANCDCPDFYRIVIYKGVLSTDVDLLPDGRVDPASLDKSTVIYQGFGYIDGGNLQIHPPTGFDTK